MQHTFEFIAELADGRKIMDAYTSSSSRTSKVDKAIRSTLPGLINIHPHEIISIKMRKL